MMAEYLVIVESPAKAKTIKKYLGKGFKVEASMGHVRDLPKSTIGVDTDKDFEPKYITIRGKGDLISKLKRAAKGVDKIYLATDSDREGEAISWHLAHILNINAKDNCRITFNEITKNAVKKALENARPIDMDLVDAQQARRVLDRIVGYKISPLLWKKVKKGLSAGRVQSVATKLICDREEEIEKFVEEEYWSLIASLMSKNKGAFFAKFYGSDKTRIELTNQEQVEKIIQEIENSQFKVQKVKKSEKRKIPMAPFITSSLQQEAYRKLGYTTKKTMMLAQQLYEGVDVKEHGSLGLVTYIRTDSTRISDEAMFEVRNLIVKRYGQEFLHPEIRTFKNKSAAQDAHEAIRPSYYELDPTVLKDSLSNDQYKLYKLIWERFVASQMAVAVYDTVNVELKTKDYLFRASGSKIKFQGFLNLYTLEKEISDDDEMDEENVNIPDLKEGDIVELKKLNPKQHFTQAPPRFSEATLVKILEENGIGRPSTYAPTITTILARGYVEKIQKLLCPTELGKIVNDIMKNHFKNIVDVDFTASMENRFDQVEEGEKKWISILQDFYGDFYKVLSLAEENIGEVELKDIESEIDCNKCGRKMVYKMGKKGKKFLACPGFPNCRNTLPIMQDANVLCPICNAKVYFKETRRSRKYLGCENNPTCTFMSWDKPAETPCPKCGKFLLSKNSGKSAFDYCSSPDCDFGKENIKHVDKKEDKATKSGVASKTAKGGKAGAATKAGAAKKAAGTKATGTKKAGTKATGVKATEAKVAEVKKTSSTKVEATKKTTKSAKSSKGKAIKGKK